MAVIITKKRKKLKPKTFGLPDEKKYPMPDKSHAANAKARATQMVKKGKLSLADKKKIDRKADKILGESASKSKKASSKKSPVKRKSTSKRRKK
jgi:hypothetical protein